MIYIMGPGGSGKTTVAEAIAKYYPDMTLYPYYTTRKMRDGESEGHPYHFITDREMNEMLEKERQCRVTMTVEIAGEGPVRYLIKPDELRDNHIVVASLVLFKELLGAMRDNEKLLATNRKDLYKTIEITESMIYPVAVVASSGVLSINMSKRKNHTAQEINRRVSYDAMMNHDLKEFVALIVRNDAVRHGVELENAMHKAADIIKRNHDKGHGKSNPLDIATPKTIKI